MTDSTATGGTRLFRFGVVAPLTTDLPTWRDRVRRIADSGPDIALDLAGSRADSKGVTIQVYRPAGRPQYATG